MADDNQQCRERAAEQHDRLQHIGPDHSLNAAEHGVKRAQHTHRDDAPVYIPAGDRRQRHRRQQDDDAHSTQLEHRETGAAEFAQATAEAHFQILVNARDVQSPIKRQETKDDQRHHHRDGQVEDEPCPVGAERPGRDGEERDRAELGGENTQAGRPPHDALAGDKKVVNRPAAAREPKAHPDEHAHVANQDDPVGRAKGLPRLGQVDLPNVGRANAGTAFAGGDDDRVAPLHGSGGDVAADGHPLRCAGCGGAARVLREIGETRPAIGHSVVQQHIAAEPGMRVLDFLLLRLEGRGGLLVAGCLGGDDLFAQAGERDKALAVCAAENKQLIRTDRRHRAGHHAAGLCIAAWLDVADFFPLAGLGIIFVGIAEHVPTAIVALHSAAEDVEAIRATVALRTSKQMRARLAVPRWQLDPTKIVGTALGQVERPKILGRALAAVTPGDVNSFADQRPGGSRRVFGERRIVCIHRDRAVSVAKREHLGRAMGDAVLPPLAADAEHATGRRDRDTVAKRPGEPRLGLGDRVVETVPRDDVDRVVINLGRVAAVGRLAPRHALGKVRTPGDDQCIVVCPGKRPSHAEGAGEIGERLPIKFVASGRQAGRTQRQQGGDSEKHGCEDPFSQTAGHLVCPAWPRRDETKRLVNRNSQPKMS